MQLCNPQLFKGGTVHETSDVLSGFRTCMEYYGVAKLHTKLRGEITEGRKRRERERDTHIIAHVYTTHLCKIIKYFENRVSYMYLVPLLNTVSGVTGRSLHHAPPTVSSASALCKTFMSPSNT